MSKKKLDGNSLNIAEMNLAIYGHMDPDMAGLDSEAFDHLKKLFQGGKPIKGRMIIYGTGGDMKGSNNFKKIWDDAISTKQA